MSQQPTFVEELQLPESIPLGKAATKAEAIGEAIANIQNNPAASSPAKFHPIEVQLMLQDGLVEEAKKVYTTGLTLE